MTKDQLWVQERAAFLTTALAAEGVVVDDGQAAALVVSLRQTFTRSHGYYGTTAAQARPLVTDTALLHLAHTMAAPEPERGDAPATRGPVSKRSRVVELPLVAATLSSLFECVKALTMDRDSDSSYGLIVTAQEFAEAIARAGRGEPVVPIREETLLEASSLLRHSAEALDWRMHYDYCARLTYQDCYEELSTAADRLVLLLAAPAE